MAHEDSAGLIGYVDFDWDGVVGEFDGKLKYKVPEGPRLRRLRKFSGKRSNARIGFGDVTIASPDGFGPTPCDPNPC